jgi:predicted nucleic acid-binding protein
MAYDVTVERTTECPTAVVKANTTWREFRTLWPTLLDEVWAFLRLLRGGDPLATLDLAFYEVTSVAIRAWRDLSAADRLRERVTAVAEDGGLVRADAALIADAAAVADEHGVSMHDAAYVVAARASGGELVSCDLRDLVSRGLARLPADAPDVGLGS